jgi:hypothetical protein
MCISVVARQRLSNHVPATMKNYWRRRFLRGPCRIKGEQAISSSQNSLFLFAQRMTTLRLQLQMGFTVTYTPLFLQRKSSGKFSHLVNQNG